MTWVERQEACGMIDESMMVSLLVRVDRRSFWVFGDVCIFIDGNTKNRLMCFDHGRRWI